MLFLNKYCRGKCCLILSLGMVSVAAQNSAARPIKSPESEISPAGHNWRLVWDVLTTIWLCSFGIRRSVLYILRNIQHQNDRYKATNPISKDPIWRPKNSAKVWYNPDRRVSGSSVWRLGARVTIPPGKKIFVTKPSGMPKLIWTIAYSSKLRESVREACWCSEKWYPEIVKLVEPRSSPGSQAEEWYREG